MKTRKPQPGAIRNERPTGRVRRLDDGMAIHFAGEAWNEWSGRWEPQTYWRFFAWEEVGPIMDRIMDRIEADRTGKRASDEA